MQRQFARVDLREHEEKILLMLALVISAVVGLTVVVFVAMTERLGQILLVSDVAHRFLSPFLGSLVGGWLLYRFFPDARGSGIPQTRVALILQRGFISFRTVIGKFVCSCISLGSGLALGREGPSVHIGAGIASVIGRRLGLSEEQVRSLIPVGTAAAVAAAFNTPLAAVLFTLEEILADLHARVVGSVVIGAATSWIVLRLILGDEPLFHVPAYQLVHPVEFLIYALLGLIGGLLSTAFVKLLLWQRARFLKVPQRWKPFTPAVGGLVVGLLALAQPGVLGVGYNLVGDALNGRMELKVMLLLLALKVVATTTSYGSGSAGGVFGPSLFIGAMLGGGVGQIAHTLLPDYTGNAGAYALVGMGAAFAGIVRTPMTSVIMIFEVTRDYTIIVPLMIANLCSYLLAQRMQKLPLYEALSRQEGITMPSPEHLPEPLTVQQALVVRDPSSVLTASDLHVHPDDPLDAALQRMGEAGSDVIPVVSRTGGTPMGVLEFRDVIAAYKAPIGSRSPGSGPAAQNWVPVVAVITVATVFIAAGLVFWQRARQSSFRAEAYSNGQALMAQGQTEEAVLAFRNALAHSPQDVASRAALGLALVESHHFEEAFPYLTEVSKSQPQNGLVWSGLAKIALQAGDKSIARQLFERALAREWQSHDEPQRSTTQIEYAILLSESGDRAKAISILFSVIEQSGGDALIGKQAAEATKTIGSQRDVEAAYAALANHFTGDSDIWLRLGEARFALGDDVSALAAYRNAIKIDPHNSHARELVARLEDVMSLDPGERNLSVRARAQRWDEIVQRVVAALSTCARTEDLRKAEALLKQDVRSLETLDKKVDAVKSIWGKTGGSCKSDPTLTHILSRLGN